MKKFLAGCIAVSSSICIAFSGSAEAQQIPVPSEQWQPISRDESGSNYSIDTGTIGRRGNSVGFWTQINHASGGIAVSRIYTVGECSSQINQRLWILKASRQGKIVTNQKLTAPPSPDPPGSVGRVLLDTVCGNASPEVQAQRAQADLVKAHLEALTRARQTNAEMINNAMRMGLEMR